MPNASLPRIELHLHLDCSVDYDGIRRLQPSITPDQYRRDFVLPSSCPDLASFLAQVPNLLRLLQTRDSLRVMVENVFEQLQRDHVMYAELRFAPLLHLECGLLPEDVVDIVDASTDDCVHQTGIEARLILCTLRHFTEAQSLGTVALVRKFRDRRVAALDLAGDEAGCPIAPHIAAYRAAREWGLQTTAHTGEACGPASVWETLRDLRPDRIGHGIRSIEDPALVEHLRRSNLHLEVCPSSNVQLVGSLSDFAHHPIEALRQQGVSLSISTDIRTFIDTTLTREYALVRQHFGWTDDTLRAANIEAVRHAFVGPDTKQALLARLTPDSGGPLA